MLEALVTLHNILYYPSHDATSHWDSGGWQSKKEDRQRDIETDKETDSTLSREAPRGTTLA